MQNYKLLPKEKLKRNTLNTSNNFSFKLLGISTSAPGYRLCYFINKQFALYFQKCQQLSDNAPNEAKEDNPFYWAESLNDRLRLFLLPNKIKSENTYILPRFKQVDFIFVIENGGSDKTSDSLLKGLKKITIIQAVFELPDTNFKPEKYLSLD